MDEDMIFERWLLATTRLMEIRGEQAEGKSERLQEQFGDYFKRMAEFMLMIGDTWEAISQGGIAKSTQAQLAEHNRMLFQDILPENYEKSYANPTYAVSQLGEGLGQILSAVYVEMRSCIAFAFEGQQDEIVIRLELLLELYGAFCSAAQEGAVPTVEDIKDIFYWFVSDYADMTAEKRIDRMVNPEGCFAAGILESLQPDRDWEDVRYLYSYGCYVGENELATARFFATLPQETIDSMASTYTEGYRIGFVQTGKDLSIKSTVDLRYPLGFERMMVKAMDNFRKMGLAPAIRRPGESLLYFPSIYPIGFEGGEVNRQYLFDHKDDKALVWDKNYVNRILEVTKSAYEERKQLARGYAGPAVVERFGQKDFDPVNKKEAVSMTQEQNKLYVEYMTKMGQLQRQYIIEEERSFTIISFPVPEIMEALPEHTPEAFAEFFREIIKVNTLDYKLYQSIQQTMIDALDQADYCEVKGMNGNRTNLRINLCKLQNPEKETIFENCVADVNIPVGEVFTSPVLEGTEGVLHVSKVFLEGLEFRDLEISFKDGLISSYSCKNFETKEENDRFISENILFRHETLPMGEFAIGTNTTAYTVARKYGVASKLPILIAEKTGPHFAVGDTCYSHAEEIAVFNPDGKEIVAKSNSKADLRDTQPEKAYFNCHTDITIPYEELGELTAVRKDGSRIPILARGRFVLPGTEVLNEALE